MSEILVDYDDLMTRYEPALGLEVHEIGRAHV